MERKKVQIYLSAANGISLDALKAGLAGECGHIRSLLPPGTNLRLSFRHPGDPLSQSAHGAEVVKSAPPFDAVIDVSGPEDSALEPLIAALGGLADRHGDRIDKSRSIAVAGTEHEITPGAGPLFISFPLRRLANISHGDFLDYWLNVHAEFGRKARVPPIKYKQFHADEAASAAAAKAAGVALHDFDGVAMSYFQDIPEIEALLGQPSVAQAALEDERRFIDHSRSMMAVCEISQDIDV